MIRGWYYMTHYESIIDHWRKTWHTPNDPHLSIVGCNSVEEVINIAVDKAHAPSVKRALKIDNGVSTKVPRAAAKAYLLTEINKEKLEQSPFTFDEYDEWAKRVCTKIRDIYRNAGIEDYTFGNAQKLFNMTIKYILSADNIDPNLPIFKVAHIPIDSVIMNTAKDRLSVRPMPSSWSQTDDIDEIISYQKRYREALYTPLAWESENWGV